jgi:hypothetical protein
MRRRPAGNRARLWAGAAILTVGALAGGLAVTAAPAYADVTTGTYTIGSPSGGVTNVTVSPSGAATDSSTNFTVSFTVSPALSGSGSDWVSLVPSTALGSTPSNIDLVGSSCIQAGTNGGAYSATGITVDLTSSCTLASGTKAEVDFQAQAPASTGTFTFAVTTSKNSTSASSNSVTVSPAGPVLTAVSYAFGANTSYTMNDIPVAGLSANGTALTLTAAATHGAGTIAFLNSGSGGAGYSVAYTPSGGSATSDTVTNASAAGATVTLTLGTALVTGDTITVTATGTNPPSSVTSEADDIAVQPGNGTVETTNSIDFGGSVSNINVAPSSTVAGATATYTVNFKAADAVSAGGYIYLTENTGPTNFSSVIGIEVIDTTQNWHFVATGATLSSGSANIPLSNSISAGDSITVILAGVTNPSSAGTISDFTVATTGDPVSADAPAYTLGANASPGVVVTVNPTTAGQIATYTISNIHASASLAGGSSTIQLAAPSGTVFPNNPSFFSISDATTASGSGTVTAALSGGGTNVVTFTVPNTINSGDAFTIEVADVLNPNVASGNDSITLHGAVTGPTPVPVTTTTTTTTVPPTTTTTKPPVKKPVIADLTTSASVNTKHYVVGIKVRCSVLACKGTITLTDVTTVVGTYKYSEKAGKTNTFAVYLNSKGTSFVKHAPKHTIKVTASITVSGGTTIKLKTALVG